jgi:hypothetical protein
MWFKDVIAAIGLLVFMAGLFLVTSDLPALAFNV